MADMLMPSEKEMANAKSMAATKLFQTAWDWNIQILKAGDVAKPASRLEKELSPPIRKMDSLKNIWRQMLCSSTNKQGVQNAIGEIDDLKDLLFDFDHLRFLQCCPELKTHEDQKFPTQSWKHYFRSSSKAKNGRWESKSHWPRFCKSAYTSAVFLSQFKSAGDLEQWIRTFSQNPETRPALPLLLSSEVHGFGFALACDLIKELGYSEYCKPDVHIGKVCKELGFVGAQDNDYFVFKEFCRLPATIFTEDNREITVYGLDKLIWLICNKNYSIENVSKDNRHYNRRLLIEAVKKSIGQCQMLALERS